jgi:bifunctional non-homologous end joining protein LigD
MSARVASARSLSTSRFLASVLPGAKASPRAPAFIAPALATARTQLPTGAAYVHEPKIDGYRMQAHLHEGRVTLLSRNALAWTARLPTVAEDMARLPARALVLDGEVVSAAESGRVDFAQLQDDLKRKRYDRLCYYAFDLLHLDGFDVRGAPLMERKRLLRAFLPEANGRAPRVLYTDHFQDGAALYEAVCALGLEGVVSKRADAPYRSGRTESWVKVKCLRRERFVVVGFVPEGGGGIAKLRLARREGRELIYVGRVGTGTLSRSGER